MNRLVVDGKVRFILPDLVDSESVFIHFLTYINVLIALFTLYPFNIQTCSIAEVHVHLWLYFHHSRYNNEAVVFLRIIHLKASLLRKLEIPSRLEERFHKAR